jgi:hypothetical protein
MSRAISSMTLNLLLVVPLASPHVSFAQSVASSEVASDGIAKSTRSVTDLVHVTLRLSETVSSATARAGQPVSLEVVDAVEIGGRVVVAAGSPARATVLIARRRGHNHRDGKLLLTIQSVSRVDGTQAQLQSKSLSEGSGKGAPIFGPCTFPFPADPVGLFRKGENVVIPKGTELVATLVLQTQ